MNNLKKPESKNVLAKPQKRGRKPGLKLNCTIRLGLTRAEMDEIIKISEERGASYSHTVRSLLKEGGHI